MTFHKHEYNEYEYMKLLSPLDALLEGVLYVSVCGYVHS